MPIAYSIFLVIAVSVPNLSMDPRIKQIRIKTGVVNRITKEKLSYIKETETEKARLLKFKDNGIFMHLVFCYFCIV